MEETVTISFSPLVAAVGGYLVGRHCWFSEGGVLGALHPAAPALGISLGSSGGTNTAPAWSCHLQKVFSQNLVFFEQVTCHGAGLSWCRTRRIMEWFGLENVKNRVERENVGMKK